MTPAASTSSLFFFNDTATTEIYTLSLHDALPISGREGAERRLGEAVACHVGEGELAQVAQALGQQEGQDGDRKSTRLNSSHSQISYAVFCLKKKTSLDLLPGHFVRRLRLPAVPRR